MLKWDYEITCATSNALTMQHAFDIRYSDSDSDPLPFWLYYNLSYSWRRTGTRQASLRLS